MRPAIENSTICLDNKSSTFGENQQLYVRKVTDDGKRAVVHRNTDPKGMVWTVEIKDLLIRDGAFWCPCAVEKKNKPQKARSAPPAQDAV